MPQPYNKGELTHLHTLSSSYVCNFCVKKGLWESRMGCERPGTNPPHRVPSLEDRFHRTRSSVPCVFGRSSPNRKEVLWQRGKRGEWDSGTDTSLLLISHNKYSNPLAQRGQISEVTLLPTLNHEYILEHWSPSAELELRELRRILRVQTAVHAAFPRPFPLLWFAAAEGSGVRATLCCSSDVLWLDAQIV